LTFPSVLVAPDKFKGSLSAKDVVEELCLGLHEAYPGIRCRGLPMADGGDGSVEAFIAAGWERRVIDAVDSRGLPIVADVAWRDSTAVVELANVCGIAMLRGNLIPWEATTLGLGIAMRKLVAQGARHVIVCLGGSASTDGGSGALAGLGYRVVDDHGREIEWGLKGLADACRIIPPSDVALLEEVRWTILTDVRSPLYGPWGAAQQFGPQKGLDAGGVQVADMLLQRWSVTLAAMTNVEVQDTPGAGAAGGAAAALVASLGARLRQGAHYIAEMCGVSAQLRSVAAVVTGEGRVDSSSTQGKVAGVIAAMAARQSIPTFVVAGGFAADAPDDLRARGLSLEELAGSHEEALARPRPLLREAGRLIGAQLRAGAPGLPSPP